MPHSGSRYCRGRRFQIDFGVSPALELEVAGLEELRHPAIVAFRAYRRFIIISQQSTRYLSLGAPVEEPNVTLLPLARPDHPPGAVRCFSDGVIVCGRWPAGLGTPHDSRKAALAERSGI